MPHYEVHRFSENRWLLDAIFYDRATAIDDAQTLVLRSRFPPAVRVLKVEEQKTGFVETVIYNKSVRRPRATRAGIRSTREKFRAGTLMSPPREGRDGTRGKQASRTVSGRPPAALLVVLLLGGVLLLEARLAAHPSGVWVFDRPEAQLPHPIRNPWSGQVSP